jgi:rare lipoprotein A
MSFGVTSFASAAEHCKASWYGPGFHGKKMANGDRFNQNDASVVAHKTLPFGTQVRITNLDNGNVITATVQDRGPFHKGRCVDVSKAGGEKLGLLGPGTARVSVVRL